jgi:hypothetical protein
MAMLGRLGTRFPLLRSACGTLFFGALQANAQAQEVFGTIAGEWQAFLSHRIQEDLALIQRVTNSATPDQILAAYSEFWQKAAEDYRKEPSLGTPSKEFAAVTKLLTKKPAAVSQTATSETSANELLSQKAA